jgi:pimeloyl-ACP methyl ester carboxylesterase
VQWAACAAVRRRRAPLRSPDNYRDRAFSFAHFSFSRPDDPVGRGQAKKSEKQLKDGYSRLTQVFSDTEYKKNLFSYGYLARQPLLMPRTLKILLAILFVLIVVYLVGPAPKSPKLALALPDVPSTAAELEQYIAANEAKHKLREDNEARIIWFDSTKAKTPYSVIYLHGFSASQEEGDPVHINFAKKFGCNLYLSRLADHGVDTTEQLLTFTVDRLWESTKEALQIGKAIGDRVILMSTSTGGSVALMLAAEYPDDVYAMINMSPNIRINDPAAFVLNNHWGLYVARTVLGGKYHVVKYDTAERYKYWNTPYRIEATTELQELLEGKMNASTFEKVRCPTLTLYYYKDDGHQDLTVKVSEMLKMHERLGTPRDKKVKIAIPNAGAHVLGSPLASGDVPAVEKACADFAIQTLDMSPVTPAAATGN